MKVVFGGRLGHDEPVAHGGGSLDPSCKGARRDSCHRSSHIVGRPHRTPIERANHQDQILPLAIKITRIYQQVMAFPVERDDPTAEIICDFVVGFKVKGMDTSKMDTVAQSLSRPGTRKYVKATICDASWAGTQQTISFSNACEKSLDTNVQAQKVLDTKA